MARPITWQNVQGPDPSRALYGTAHAAEMLSRALGGMGDTFKTHQDGVRDRNTQSFLDALSQYSSPEAMQEAINSGAIDQLRQGFGTMINQDVARAAAGNSLEEMMKRNTAVQSHMDAQTLLDNRDALNKAQFAAAQGDNVAAINTLEGIENLPDAGKHLKDALSGAKYHADLVSSRGQEERANNQDARNAAITSQALASGAIDLAEKQSQAGETQRARDLEAFLDPYVRSARDLVESGGMIPKTASEALRLAGREAEAQGLGTSTQVDAMLEKLNSTLHGASRTFGQERAAEAVVLETKIQETTERLQRNPLYGGTTSVENMVESVGTLLESRELIPANWRNRGEKKKLEEVVGKNLHRRMELKDDDGNVHYEPIPLAIHQQALLAAYDRWGPGGDIGGKYEKELERLANSPEYLGYMKEMRELEDSLRTHNAMKSLRSAVSP